MVRGESDLPALPNGLPAALAEAFGIGQVTLQFEIEKGCRPSRGHNHGLHD